MAALARILAAPAANLQTQINQAVANVERRISDTVAADVQANIDATVTERVTVLDAGRQGFIHAQPEPASVWYLHHGLPFEPAGIDVTAADGTRWWPAVQRETGVVVLLFPEPVAGSARLS